MLFLSLLASKGERVDSFLLCLLIYVWFVHSEEVIERGGSDDGGFLAGVED